MYTGWNRPWITGTALGPVALRFRSVGLGEPRRQPLLHVRVAWLRGHICPLVRIDVVIIKFLATIATSEGMTSSRPGIGSTYLGGYRDKDDDWLDGGKFYTLRVPANAPAKRFWSVTVYHNDTRYLIQNKHKIADRSSRMDLIKNKDGSVDIYFGPTPPKGKEKNWIPTNPGEGWFTGIAGITESARITHG